MSKFFTIISLTALIISTPSYALFGLDSNDSDAITKAAAQLTNSAQNSSGLITELTDQLGVSTTQATGGAGALLAMASSQLDSSSVSELTGLSGGVNSLVSTAQTTNSALDSMDAVKTAFEQLGLDNSMVEQYAPIVLAYLTEQGASSDLVSSLTSVWN